MSSNHLIDRLWLLLAEHREDAAAGEVFLALEGAEANALTEIWKATFCHPNREDAVILEVASASRWGDRDLGGMAKAVFGEPRSARAVLQMAGSMLGSWPHSEAWRFLEETPISHESGAVHAAYLTILAKSAPRLALSLLQTVEGGNSSGSYRQKVIRAAARSDAEATVAWMKEGQTVGGDAQAVATELAGTDPLAALSVAQWMAGLEQDYEADGIAGSVFEQWARKNPAAAGAALLEWIGGTSSRTPVTSWYTGTDLKDVCARVFALWAKTEPKSALESASTIAPAHFRKVAMNSIGIGWPDRAEGLLAARSLPLPDRLAFMELLAPKLARKNPALLKSELETLPPPADESEAGVIWGLWQHLGEQEAEAFKAKTPHLLDKDPPPTGSFDANLGALISQTLSSIHSPADLEQSLAKVRDFVERTKS